MALKICCKGEAYIANSPLSITRVYRRCNTLTNQIWNFSPNSARPHWLFPTKSRLVVTWHLTIKLFPAKGLRAKKSMKSEGTIVHYCPRMLTNDHRFLKSFLYYITNHNDWSPGKPVYLISFESQGFPFHAWLKPWRSVWEVLNVFLEKINQSIQIFRNNKKVLNSALNATN